MKIKTEKEYENALTEIENLMDIGKDDPRFKRLLKLVKAVEKYEKKYFPII